MPCNQCEDPNCDGKVGELREFVDWTDLVSHARDEAQIVEWVNKLHHLVEMRRIAARRVQAKNRLLRKTVERVLDLDELERLERQIDENLEKEARNERR